ncbi:hypothetical protein J6590_062316 [Homalodisca vitripennis]|nr:hypothetical protein J6590_062316 [Homalodisca vitripennis]
MTSPKVTWLQGVPRSCFIQAATCSLVYVLAGSLFARNRRSLSFQAWPNRKRIEPNEGRLGSTGTPTSRLQLTSRTNDIPHSRTFIVVVV